MFQLLLNIKNYFQNKISDINEKNLSSIWKEKLTKISVEK